MATKEKQSWDPYQTCQQRDFVYRPCSAARTWLSPLSVPCAFCHAFSQSEPFGSTLYKEDFTWKPFSRPESIRTGSASENRRNNPHPSKSFMMWRLPRGAPVCSEYVSSLQKCSPSEWEMSAALAAQYKSTYRWDFTGWLPDRRLLTGNCKVRPHMSANTEMRDNYRRPIQRPELTVDRCLFSCVMDRNKECSGIVPTVLQKQMQTQQQRSQETTYDRFCGKRVAQSKHPEELQRSNRISPDKDFLKTVALKDFPNSAGDYKLAAIVTNSYSPERI